MRRVTRWYVLVAALSMVCAVQASLTQDNFLHMREAMRREIVLGPDTAYNHLPIVKQYIDVCAHMADSLSHSMRRDTSFLWDAQSLLTGVPAYTPYHVHKSYINLHRMARAWAYPASPLYHDSNLLNDIRYGLDFLARNAYNDSLPQIGNWWEWKIGIPFDYSNIVSILYDVLSPQELDTYARTAGSVVRRTVVHGNLTYANQASVCRNLLFVGVLTNNEEDVRIACDYAVKAFVDTTSVATRNAAQEMYDDILRTQSRYQHNTVLWAKEGLYEDGTFIQHIAIPYIGAYGVEMIEFAADMALLLNNVPIAIPESIKNILPLWITRTYLPAIYRGGFMTMFMGRGAYKRNPFYYARSCILNIYRVLSLLPESLQPQVLQACRDMHLKLDNIDSPYEKMDPMPAIAYTIDCINHSGPISASDKPFSIVYAAGDRVIHQMPRARFGLAMSSNRIGKYEAFITAVDTENVTGWYTADGMTYLYTPDNPEHYASYVRRVNPYLIPGTTVDRVQRYPLRSDMVLFSHSCLAPDIARAGGTCLDNRYSVAGMQLLGFDAELHAKKSWFMFDDEIVCLGSDIHQTRELEVLTVVENHITDTPWVTAPKYAWLNNISGYYFPERDRFFTNVSETGCKELFISHGKAPVNGHYAYVILPRFSLQETKHYANYPQIQILAHSNDVHAVTKPRLNIVACYFFDSAKVAEIYSDGSACVLMQHSNKMLTMAISDPTWSRDRQLFILDGNYHLIDATIPDICSVENSHGKTRITVLSKNRMGQTLTIRLKKNH